MEVRITLMEHLLVEANGTRIEERRFPGRQGRLLFAYLVIHEGRAIPRDELAGVLWGDELPATWQKALRVLMTKLRALLEEGGLDGSSALTAAFGCYRLALPAGAWVDVDAAADAVVRAEGARATRALDEARTQASSATELARRTFLPGEEGLWVDEQRRDLRDVLVRALECLRDVALTDGDLGDAVRYAAEITELEPFRESSYRALMQAHAAAGNPAEALRVYERCRRFLADELGAYPSAESEAAYLEILRRSQGTPAGKVDRVEPRRRAPGRRRRPATSRSASAGGRSPSSSPASCCLRQPAPVRSPLRHPISARSSCSRPASCAWTRRRSSRRRSSASGHAQISSSSREGTCGSRTACSATPAATSSAMQVTAR